MLEPYDLKKAFPRRKLNQCAHCESKECTVVVGIDGHVYFMCFNHWLLLTLMRRAAAKVGILI